MKRSVLLAVVLANACLPFGNWLLAEPPVVTAQAPAAETISAGDLIKRLAVPADQHRAELVKTAWEQFLGKEEFLAMGNAADALAIARLTEWELPADQKRKVLQALRRRFVDAPEIAEGLPPGPFVDLFETLSTESNFQSHDPELLSRWVHGGDQWKSSSPGQFYTLLMVGLPPDFAEGKQFKQQFTQVLWTNYLSDPQSLTKFDPMEIQRASYQSIAYLTNDQKQHLIDSFNRQLLAKGNAVGRPELEWMLFTLEALGESESQLSKLVSDWVLANPQWSTRDPSDQIILVKYLRDDSLPGLPQLRKQMVTHIQSTYLGINEPLANTDRAEFMRIYGNLCMAVPFALRRELSQQLERQFTENAAYMAQVTPEEWTHFGTVLSVDNDAAAWRMTLIWVRASNQWQTANWTQMFEVAWCLQSSEGANAHAAAKEIASVLFRNYLSTPELLTKFSDDQLLKVMAKVGLSFSPEQQRQLYQMLKARLVDNKPVLATLSPATLSSLDFALSQLAVPKTQREGVILSWLHSGDTWKTYKVQDLVLATLLLVKSHDPASVEGLRQLTQFNTDRLISQWSDEKLSPASKIEPLQAVGDLCISLTNDQKEKLLATAQKTFSTRSLLANLAPGDLVKLQWVLASLGAARDQQARITNLWLQSHDDWKSASVEEWIQTLHVLNDEAPEVGPAAGQVALVAWNNALGDPKFLSQGNWNAITQLADAAGPSLSADQKQQLYGAIKHRFIEDRRQLGEMDLPTVMDVADLVQKLGDESNRRAEFATAWMQSSERWKQEPLISLSDLVQTLSNTKNPSAAVTGTQSQAFNYLMERCFNSSVPLSQEDMDRVPYAAWLIGESLPTDQKRRFKELLVSRYIAKEPYASKMTAHQLYDFDNCLRKVGATDRDIAGAVLQWAKICKADRPMELGDYWIFYEQEYLPYFLTVESPAKEDTTYLLPNEIAALKDQVVDAQGNVKMPVAQVAAYAYKFSGQLAQWQSFLDQKIADPQIQGDQRSEWFMARGYAAEIVSKHPGVLNGRQWISDAIASAHDPSWKLDCFHRFYARDLAAQRYDDAANLLKILDKQLGASSEALAQAAQWPVAVAVAQNEVQAQQAGADQAVHQSWRTEIQTRLASAVKNHDAEQIQRYEQLLEKQN